MALKIQCDEPFTRQSRTGIVYQLDEAGRVSISEPDMSKKDEAVFSTPNSSWGVDISSTDEINRIMSGEEIGAQQVEQDK